MRIDPNTPYQGDVKTGDVNGAADTNRKGPQATTADNSGIDAGDRVDLSGTAAQVQAANAALADAPDVRSDRVAALQSQIQSGQYNPTNDQIAGAMMREYFGDSGR